MLGPALDAVTAWLTGTAQGYTYGPARAAPQGQNLLSDYSDADHFGVSKAPAGLGSGSDLVGLLANLSLGLWAGVTGSGGSGAQEHRRSGRASGTNKGAPTDTCMGIVVHLFLDAAQV